MLKLPQPSRRPDPLILLGAIALLIILLAHLVTIQHFEESTANAMLLALVVTTGVLLVFGRRLVAESLSDQRGIPRVDERHRRSFAREEAIVKDELISVVRHELPTPVNSEELLRGVEEVVHDRWKRMHALSAKDLELAGTLTSRLHGENASIQEGDLS